MSNKRKITITEPYFWWRVEWYHYLKSISANPERLALAEAIADYGLNGTEPTQLCCEDLDYFNEVIRPDLDKQRKQLKNGKKIRL